MNSEASFQFGYRFCTAIQSISVECAVNVTTARAERTIRDRPRPSAGYRPLSPQPCSWVHRWCKPHDAVCAATLHEKLHRQCRVGGVKVTRRGWGGARSPSREVRPTTEATATVSSAQWCYKRKVGATEANSGSWKLAAKSGGYFLLLRQQSVPRVAVEPQCWWRLLGWCKSCRRRYNGGRCCQNSRHWKIPEGHPATYLTSRSCLPRERLFPGGGRTAEGSARWGRRCTRCRLAGGRSYRLTSRGSELSGQQRAGKCKGWVLLWLLSTLCAFCLLWMDRRLFKDVVRSSHVI